MFRGGSLQQHTGDQFTIGTWNVRGFTDLKLQEFILHMKFHRISILCMQETRVGKSDVYFEDGFQIIMSGRSDDSVCWAGVGFIIAPWARDRLKNFKQICDRMAYVQFTVPGGSMALFCVYAPHNAKPQAERVEFYVRLDEEYRACSSICGKLIAGDLNARLGHAELGEEEVIGQHTFGRRASG